MKREALVGVALSHFGRHLLNFLSGIAGSLHNPRSMATVDVVFFMHGEANYVSALGAPRQQSIVALCSRVCTLPESEDSPQGGIAG